MKRTLFAIIFAALLVLGFEYTNVLGHQQYKPSVQLEETSEEFVLSWSKPHYPALYRIEILKHPPNQGTKKPAAPVINSYYTWQNKIPLNKTYPFHTYGRISANGLFRQPLGEYSEPILLDPETPVKAKGKDKPIVTSQRNQPVSVRPFLTWKVLTGAVYYEIEFLSAPPENPNGIEASKYRVFSSREVFTAGYNANLSNIKADRLYWRVRALNYDGEPLGVFSDAELLVIDKRLEPTFRPVITSFLNNNGSSTPLYPAYSWIPIAGTSRYEVEVTSQLPENPDTAEPSRYRIWHKQVTGFACYDEEARVKPGVYYWRVRGIDDEGKPLGLWSESGKFIVNPAAGIPAATFGDSITHGGGAVSYSPADMEYSYQTYLTFPTVNLGRSGDTAETMLERFERDVLPFKPRYLLILGGTNSLRGGTPATEVIRSLSLIRDKCRKNGIRPIFLTLPPISPGNIKKVFDEETVSDWQAQFDTVNDFLRTQRYCIDLEPFFTDDEGELPSSLAIDGLHLDIPGKKLMAQIINLNWEKVTR